MRLTLMRAELAAALALADQATAKGKRVMPILQNVLLEAASQGLTISACDMEVYARRSVAARVQEGGSLCAPSKQLLDAANSLGGEEVEIEAGESKLVLKSGRARLSLPVLAAADFPEVPQAEMHPWPRWRGRDLSEALDKVLPAVPTTGAGFHLHNVLFEPWPTEAPQGINLVVTDGHRLHKANLAAEGEFYPKPSQFLLPKTAAHLLERLARAADEEELGITISGRQMVVRHAGTTLTLRAGEGQFPAYEVVIPKKNKAKFSLRREGLAALMKRAGVCAELKYGGCRLTFGQGSLQVTAADPERGELVDSMDAEGDGEAVVGINRQYMLDICGRMKSEILVVGVDSDDEGAATVNPLKITGEGDRGFLAVIMPMRL